MKPYYEHAGITIYHGDCRDVIPTLPKCELLLTDPPYGIKQANGMGGCGFDGFGRRVKRSPKQYEGKWDEKRPDANVFPLLLASAETAIIWGGNYFTDSLPVGRKWLVWDKQQTMPSYSDVELAWTNLEGIGLKMFRYNGSGLMAEERDRFHPTQKPVELMYWCMVRSKTSGAVIDPYAGSGSTLIAAKNSGRSATGIELEERYCEIAATRLSQEVMAFA